MLLTACSGDIGGPEGNVSDPSASASAGAVPAAGDNPVAGNANMQPDMGTNVGAASPPAAADGSEAPSSANDFPAPAFDLRGQPLHLHAIPLTNLQWARAVRDMLQLDALPTQSETFLEPPTGFAMFPNNERVLEVSNSLRESYRLAAGEVTEQVLSTPNGVANIGAGADADTFIRTLGRRAFRRPLSDDEFTRYRAAFDAAAQLSGDQSEFDKGAGVVIEAFLQSPNFLYRTELANDGQPLNNFEVAAKLSLWILNTIPSDELLDQAERGELSSPEAVAGVARQMLDRPEASETAVAMFAEMFKFVRYFTIVKSSPEYDPAMGDEADEVSRLFFKSIFEDNAGLREVLTRTEGFVGPNLASLYGLPEQTTISKHDFGEQRVGFFSQVPYLMLMGSNAKSDAIHRGLFINYQVLCAQLPEPNFALPEPAPYKPGQSDREYIDDMTGFGTCGAACHGAYINPIGYAFEHFDGLGRLRTMDADRPVDASAAYPFTTGVQSFDGAQELMDILVESDEAHHCFAKNIASYGLQRDIVAEDQQLLDQLAGVSRSSDGSMKNLVVELVQSDAFRTRQGETL